MGVLWQDVSYSVRLLVKRPGVTLMVVVNLALGIGASVAIFSVVNAVMLQPLLFPQSHQLVLVEELNPKVSPKPIKASFPNFQDWRTQSGSIFAQLAAYRNQRLILTGGPDPERVAAQSVSSAFFLALGANAKIGRTFSPGRDDAHGENVVVLSHHLWQRYFAAGGNVLGKTVTLEGVPHTVVGIMPPGFRFLEEADVWTLLEVAPSMRQMRGARFLQVVGRLKSDVTLEEARARMDTLALQMAEAYPETNAGWGVSLSPLRERLVGQLRQRLLMLLGAVGLVLLIACANTSNLLLGETSRQHQEFAVRAALGATTTRLLRQSLTKSVGLGLLGGSLGVVMAVWGVHLLLAMSPGSIPQVGRVELDRTVLGFALLVSFLSSLLSGLVPAVRASRPDLNQALKEGTRIHGIGFGSLKRQPFRSLLIASQVALAQILLIGAVLLGVSFFNLSAVNPGFLVENLLCMQISLPAHKYPEASSQAAFFAQLLERVGTLSDIRSAALATVVPLSGIDPKNTFALEPGDSSDGEWASVRTVSPNYFRTMGIPLLAGRLFTAQDTGQSPPVLVINRSMAHRLWPNEDPLGKLVFFGEDPHVVIGVVGNVRDNRLDTEEEPKAYFSFLQDPQPWMVLVTRADSDPLKLVPMLRTQVRGIDKDQPVERVQTMADLIAHSVAQPRFSALLLAVFAALALVLAMSGVYGVTSYSVTQRTHEIGIRMALGAERHHILELIIGQGLRLAALGLGLGIVGSVAGTQLLRGMLYGVGPIDLTIIVSVAFLLAGLVLVASCIPALRAARVDPLTALRYE